MRFLPGCWASGCFLLNILLQCYPLQNNLHKMFEKDSCNIACFVSVSWHYDVEMGNCRKGRWFSDSFWNKQVLEWLSEQIHMFSGYIANDKWCASAGSETEAPALLPSLMCHHPPFLLRVCSFFFILHCSFLLSCSSFLMAVAIHQLKGWVV